MNDSTKTASELLEAEHALVCNFSIEGDFNIHLAPPKSHSSLPIASILACLAGDKLFKESHGKAPASVVRDAGRPLKIMADGKRVDARESITDHVALLFPETGWMIGVDTLCRDGQRPFASQQDTEAAAKACRLLGYDDWGLADDVVYGRHVIDRRFHKPAADPNLYPRLLLNDWYWTSTVTRWSESAAFFVGLNSGNVHDFFRSDSGFGLACRRARQ